MDKIFLLGHVKWFSEGQDSAFLVSLNAIEWSVVILAISIAVVLLFFIDGFLKKYDHFFDKRFSKYRQWVPTVVRYSTAILLIANFWQGYFYASNINYSETILYSLIVALLMAVALLLIFGVLTRTAGAVLLIVYLASVFIVDDPLQLFDHLEYIGIGLFLLLSPAGRLSINGLKDPLEFLKHKDYLALPLLKTFVGLGLIVLAFSEKLMNMTLANEFLQDHSWNFLSAFGLDNRYFIIFAGTMELIIGLSFVINKATRLTTLALLSIMVVTAALLGIEEVIGHLFAVGIVFGVWVGPNNDLWAKKQPV